MSEEVSALPRLLLTVLFAFWAMAFVYSFVAFALTEPDDIGFTMGMNRIRAFLGWQGIAGLLALCIFGVSRSWPPGASVRRLGLVPLVPALGLGAVLLGLIGWAAMTG